MTKEEKELLLKDLCARLPYHPKGVKLNAFFDPEDITVIGYTGRFVETVDDEIEVKQVRLYLHPMSSMTKEELNLLKEAQLKDTRLYAESLTKAAAGDTSMRGKVITHFAADWCDKNNFDYRGLIPMGLALEAPEGMYKNE